MGILDILLMGAGLAAGVFSYLSGSDSLYKLFLGLIIGFLLYALIASQVELIEVLSPSLYNSYQSFLAGHTTSVLSFSLLMVPFLGLFFMLHHRFSIQTSPGNMSHILLGLLLPIFLIGILAFLGEGSLLAENLTWQRIFDFFEKSGIYRLFQTLPWAIFALLMFLIFYKTLFILLGAFFIWLWNDVIMMYFKSWNEDERRSNETKEDE